MVCNITIKGNYLAMATLAIGLIMATLFQQWDQHVGHPEGMAGIPHLSIGGFAFNSEFSQYFLVWAFCIIILLISQNIVRSQNGQSPARDTRQ